jgi:early secretory antigenic target protein ESAT-6
VTTVSCMTRYQVDSDEVLGASTAVRATISRIQSESASLQSQLVNLQNSWSGQASVAFQGLALDWKATQNRVDETLGAVSQALSVAAQQYAEIEAANARLFAH